ncbi:TNT domain-containing protein [Saccharomonospora glauca]|jgi:hypothetical protein|uniref:DUF4237 domain-containing protein n=1 Tax=Saccharomonospora glauca K62 TaxID=928724 RepID=I1CY32_9PSEU|nr:TNT domain-containing protein [Saccharomonospora glauca]EIE97606.1 hypothetical protein SacglDRAFT_00660 [Saccharomonospora glauca K62]
MGIELPAELAAVARAIGVSWPEADEDALREQAESWRRAARELTTLAGDADACAVGALKALSGAVAETVRQRWASLGDADSGLLAEVTRGATQAADRLEHAAEQVSKAKVELVRRLVDAAKTFDAVVVAADSGHPSALLGLDTMLRGAAGDLGAVTRDLVDSVAAPAESLPRPGVEAGADGIDAVPPDASKLGEVPEPEETGETRDTEEAAGTPGEHVDEGTSGEEPPSTEDTASDELSTEDTGPIAISQIPTPPSGQRAVPGLGADAPTPPSGTVLGQAGAPAPYAVAPLQQGQTHLSGFAPSAVPNPMPNPMASPMPNVSPNPMPGPVPGPAPYASPQWGGYAVASNQPAAQYVPPASQGRYQAAQWNPAVPYVPQGTPAPPQPPRGHPQQPVQAPASQPPQGHPQQPRQSPAGQPPPPAPHPGAAAVAVGAPRKERESIVALFVVHMFPIGHLPVPSDRPARQLPVPSGDTACGVLRFPPHDHPESDTVEVERALAELRGGGRKPAPPPAEVLPGVPEDITEGYDPLGENSESEWNRRYLVRDGEKPEYAWPPPERFPEGCHERGEPVLLEEGTVLDRFGTAHGRVFSADGTRFASRSLPPRYLDSGYRRYRVVKRMPAWKAVSAPWFGQPGGGVRYRTVYSAAELVVLGHLADITFEERA